MNIYSCASNIKFYLLAAQISGIKPPLSITISPPGHHQVLWKSINCFYIHFNLIQSVTPFLFKMQAKIFLSSLLATLLAVSVAATPTRVETRDIKSSHSLDGTVTPFQEVATDVGVTGPRPKGPTITPKDSDVPIVSTSVEAKDLVSSKLSSANWASRQWLTSTIEESYKENSWVYFCEWWLVRKSLDRCSRFSSKLMGYSSNFSGSFLYICLATNGGCNNWNITWRYSISSFGPDEGTIPLSKSLPDELHWCPFTRYYLPNVHRSSLWRCYVCCIWIPRVWISRTFWKQHGVFPLLVVVDGCNFWWRLRRHVWICAHAGSLPLISVLAWTIFGSSGWREGVSVLGSFILFLKLI